LAENLYSQRDGAHWHNDFSRWLRLKHIGNTGRIKKNIAEWFIHQIKDRAKSVLMTLFSLQEKGLRKREESCDRERYNVWNSLKLSIYLFALGRDRNGL
jgi:hypothetical protein